MRRYRVLAWCGGGIAALLLTLFLVLQTPPGLRSLGALVSSVASTAQSRLEIVGLHGSFPTHLAADRIELSDVEGPWLRIEEARLDWSFAALFARRLDIERLSARRVTVLRPPLPSAEPAKSDSSGGRPFLDVELRSLAIGELQLAPQIGGVDSRWRVDGSGRLARDLPTSRLALSGERTDRASGRLSVEIQFDPALQQVVGELAFEERSDQGVAAALLGRPDLEAVALRLQARGNPNDGRAQFLLSAGDAMTANGSAEWKHEDGVTRGMLRLIGGAPGLPDGPLARLLRGQISLTAEGTLDASNVAVFTATLEGAPGRIAANGRHDVAKDALEASAIVELPDSQALSDFVGPASWRALKSELRANLKDVLAARPHGTVDATFAAEDVIVAAAPVPALGRVEGSAKVAISREGLIKVEAFDARSPLLAVKATADLVPPARTAEARATLSVADFTPLSTLAGVPLHGNGTVDVILKARDGMIEANWRGRLRDLEIERVPGDALKPGVAISGTADMRSDGSWRLASIGLATEAASVTIDGRGRGRTGEIDLALKLARLSAIEPAAEGNATITAKLVLAESGAVNVQFDSRGEAMGQPLSVAGRAARESGGRLVVPALKGQWASASIEVTDFALAASAATGTARVRVGDIGDIGRLVGETMAGSLELDVKADGAARDAKVEATLRGRRLRGFGEFNQVDGTLTSDLKTADVTVKASGAGLVASLAANLRQTAEGVRFVVTHLDGRQGELAASLIGTAHAHLVGTRLTLEQATRLNVAGAIVTVAGVVDPAASNLTAEVTALPLARMGAPVDGTLQAKAHLRGALAAPRVEATYAINGLKMKRPEARFMQAMAVAGSATLSGNQATFDAKATGGATGLTVSGRATLPRGRTPLSASARVTGTGDLALIAPLAGTAVQGLSGRLQPNIEITVNGDKVSGTGTLAVTGLALNQPASGLHLERGEALLVLQDQSLQVQRLSLRTAGGGEITATGSAQLDGGRGFPVDLQIAVRKAQLANRPDLVATASAALKVAGSLNEGFTVSGPVTVDRAEVNIGVSQSADYPTIEVREINKPGVANPPPAARRKAGAAPPPPKPVGGPAVRLALSVDAPRAVFVRGRGVDAEVGGKFEVGGVASQPTVTGALSLRRGDFNLAGRRLVFSRGNVNLVRVDSIEPNLDFLASTTAGGTTVNIAITGTSREPKIALSSSPAMPQDELMAMLLFGRTTSSLSAVEVLQVAQAVAELTGATQGGGLIGGLRKKLGLDRLSIDTSGTDPSSTAISGGRYVAPGVYVGAKQGASSGSSRAVVEVEVLRNTKIEADIGADSNGRLGIKMEWDY